MTSNSLQVGQSVVLRYRPLTGKGRVLEVTDDGRVRVQLEIGGKVTAPLGDLIAVNRANDPAS